MRALWACNRENLHYGWDATLGKVDAIYDRAALVALPLGRASAAHGTPAAWIVIDLAAAAVLARLLARD